MFSQKMLCQHKMHFIPLPGKQEFGTSFHPTPLNERTMKAILTVQLFILVAYLVARCWCSSDVPQGPGVAPQLCGTNNTKYYCPLDQLCKPRETRCTIASTCVKENGEVFPVRNCRKGLLSLPWPCNFFCGKIS